MFEISRADCITCVASSGVFVGGTEGRFLLRPRVTASYSFDTRLALI